MLGNEVIMSKRILKNVSPLIHTMFRVAMCLVALFFAQVAVAQNVPTFTPLQHFDADSNALFVSGDGLKVVGHSANETFSWDGALVGLGRLTPTEQPAVATSASANGNLLVGWSESFNEVLLQIDRKIVRWDNVNGWADLGNSFVDPSVESWHLSCDPQISGDGSTVVAMSVGVNGNRIWRWTIEGWFALPVVQGEPQWIANSLLINTDGSVILANGDGNAFRWTSNNNSWNVIPRPSGTPTDSVMKASCLSSDGLVVIGELEYFDNNQSSMVTHIFRCEFVGDVISEDLGDPLLTSEDTSNRIELVLSADGLVIAGNAINHSGIEYAFRYQQNSTDSGISDFVLLGTLQGDSGSRVTAINSDGTVLVGSSYQINLQTGNETDFKPFRWTVAGMVQIAPLVGGATDAEPNALSSDGSVVVGVMARRVESTQNYVDFRAFRWTTSSALVSLGSLQTPVNPNDININGSVVVGSAGFGVVLDEHTFYGEHAFRWTSSGLVDLGVNTGQDEILSRSAFVSGDGLVVVGEIGISIDNQFAANTHAFRWTNAGGKVDLGTLPNGSEGSDTNSFIGAGFLFAETIQKEASGSCVSNDGSVVVGTSESLSQSLEVCRAFRWTAMGGMQPLGFLPDTQNSAALAVSNNGLVVVGASGNFNSDSSMAFRWTDGGGMQALGSLAGTPNSAALFTSLNGSVVVGTCQSNSPVNVRKVFRWEGGAMADLGFLPGGAQDLYWPVAVSDDGSVVLGISEHIDNETQVVSRRAFRWSVQSGMVALPTEITRLHKRSLSGDGLIIAGDCSSKTGPVACIWTQANGLQNLKSYLLGLGVTGISDLFFNECGISADGNAIAVSYRDSGRDSTGIVQGLQILPVLPANDDCMNANLIQLGSLAFDTNGATTDGNNPTAQFCGSASGSFYNDIWYSFTAPSSGTISISTCNQSVFDTRIDILDVCGGILLACDDDGCVVDLNLYVEFSALAGQNYIIRVGAYQNTFVTGTITLTLVNQAPTISSVSPSSGSTLGGTAITITGTNLTGATSVTVGGVAATDVVVSSTSVTAVTPAGTAGLTSVAVTTPGGTATLPSAFTFVVPAPTIESISPTSGSTLGGTAITITGTNLTDASSVTVGGVAATDVVVVSSTSVTAVTPAGSVGAKDVVVTTPGGSATLPSAFTFVVPAPLPPDGVAASDGTFTNKVSVSWNAVSGATGYKVFRSGTAAAIGTVGSSSLTFSDLTATPGTSYDYSVKTNGTGGLSPPSLFDAGYRNLSAPTSVAAADGTSTLHVAVTWVASIGATGYQVWRSNGSSAATQIGTAIQTPFNDVGASPGVSYSYTVKATGAVGVSSASAGNSGFKALSPPNGVAASDGASAASVKVTWNVVPGATAYKIFRSGSSSAIGTVATFPTFSDTSAAAGVEYIYTVKAVYGTLGMSGASLDGDTGYRNRPAPANVNATDTDTTKVRVTWSAVTGATGYEVFRSIGGAPAIVIASPTGLLFDDTTIASGTTAIYSVKAKYLLTGSSPAQTVTTFMSATNSGTRP